jgi:hypothetical protein
MLSQEGGQVDRLEYLVRLPEAPGTYLTTAEVAAVQPSGIRVFGTYPLGVTVDDADDAIGCAERLVSGIPDGSVDAPRRDEILQWLSSVRTRGPAGPDYCEGAIAEVLAAIASAKEVRSVDATSLRLSLGAILAEWEARCYPY